MEKRYQVFVSSTYTDLIAERAEVMQALLELDCMPAGMELFPAANDSQWTWIKRVIDESDYYMVIVGGRYGTISPATGLSFTEMEYRYAVSAGKPVIAFLHEDPSAIPTKHTERSPDAQHKLNEFRELLQQRLCKFWSNAADLGAKVSRSVTQLLKQYPAVGWIRADTIPKGESAAEVLALQRELNAVRAKLAQISTEAPPGTQFLAQGKDIFTVHFVYTVKAQRDGAKFWYKTGTIRESHEITWDELFSVIGPSMLVGADDSEIASILNRLLEHRVSHELSQDHTGERVTDIRIIRESLEAILIQLRALKLINAVEGEYSRKWVLTEYGDNYMAKLIAVQRKAK